MFDPFWEVKSDLVNIPQKGSYLVRFFLLLRQTNLKQVNQFVNNTPLFHIESIEANKEIS